MSHAVALPFVVDRLRAAGCVFAEEEAALLLTAARTAEELAAMIAQREAGVPLEQILGWVEFCGLRVAVAPGVFVPRRRTQLLVREAAAVTAAGSVVLDLCCGCGAIGLAVRNAVGDVALHASDIEPAAVECARRNLVGVGTAYEGDLFAPLPPRLRGRVGTLTANVPYVPTDAIATMPREAREYEPRITLDGGADGLAVLRRVAADAPGWLEPGGHLLVETSVSQSPAAVEVFSAAGLQTRAVTSGDDVTVVVGRRPIRSAARPTG
jgi:release factor glutamine methyltransferase